MSLFSRPTKELAPRNWGCKISSFIAPLGQLSAICQSLLAIRCQHQSTNKPANQREKRDRERTFISPIHLMSSLNLNQPSTTRDSSSPPPTTELCFSPPQPLISGLSRLLCCIVLVSKDWFHIQSQSVSYCLWMTKLATITTTSQSISQTFDQSIWAASRYN